MKEQKSTLKQHEMLRQAFFLVVKSGLFPDAEIKDLVLDLLMLHKNGYLYVSADDNNVVRYIMCAYRVKEIPKEYPKEYPAKEEGDNFYVAWAVSKDNDTKAIKRLLTSMLDLKPEIKTVAFHDLRDGEKLKTFSRKIKKTPKKKTAKKKTLKKKTPKKKTTKKKKVSKSIETEGEKQGEK